MLSGHPCLASAHAGDSQGGGNGMSTEMLILVVLGIQTTLILGTIGLVAMLLSGRINGLERRLETLAAQQHADHKELSAKIDQVILHLAAGQSSREEARP